jgi:uroporphyrin-III C-methyltransferase / precorrin-2 dehydrogenase / sirohydrochlorin ferrochelatase
MHSLPIFVRLDGRPVIVLGDGDAAAAKRQIVDRAGAQIVGEDEAASLAIVAIEDEAEAIAAVQRLKARGILVNAVDRPDLCDFTLPAIIDRDPVLVAIGTGGASAGLAKALRQRLEAILPQSLGSMASLMKSGRGRMRERWPGAPERRRAVDAAFSEGGLLDPFRSLRESAFDEWIAGETAAQPCGLRVVEVASDDPDQLTLEQARWLGQADCIVHAAGVSPAIVARARADALRLCQAAPPNPLPDGLTIQLVRKASA